MIAAQERSFEQRLEKRKRGCALPLADDPPINTVKSQTHAQSVRGADRRASEMHAQRETPSTMGEPSRQTSGGTGDSSAKDHGRGKRSYRTTEFRTYNALKQRLEALI